MTGFILADVAGTKLSAEDYEVLLHPKLAGIVLFARNFETPQQLTELTRAVKKLKPDCIISVDQEGGRVQRFKNGFTLLPSMRHWGQLYRQDAQRARAELGKTITQLAQELTAVGVNLNLAPVMDLDRGLNTVIAERSFAHDPLIVAELAEVVIESFHRNHMPAVGKHFPGHGAVKLDSHLALPTDTRAQIDIQAEDMLPFRQLANKLDAIMPSHIIYTAFDTYPTTFSKKLLQGVLRQQLGFNGVVISDDLSMGAAAEFGGYVERAQAAHAAGCDLLTICNNREATQLCLQDKQLMCSAVSKARIQTFVQRWIPQ